MMQQSSRYLLKSLKKLSEGQKLEGYLAYLNDTEKLINSKLDVTTVDQFLDLETLSRVLATRAAYRLKELYQIMSASSAPNQEKTNDIFAIDVQLATRLHIEYIVF